MAAVGQATDSYVESKIRVLEGPKMQAYRAQDLRTLDKILDDSFVSVSQDGEERSKPKVLVRLKEVASSQYLLDQMIVRLCGETAIVTRLYDMHGVRHGKAFVERGRFVDTWPLKRGSWGVHRGKRNGSIALLQCNVEKKSTELR